ncbi:MAG: tRNA-dihydrouridine synthase family protein [Candidatus Pacebacteria bacterium]|nr:tRNA-dihydrouridine synthase family protein [Candidatus Paceibacterota bacterium]
MNQGFWKKLNKPFFALAPMADVTDSAFRQIIIKCGKPDVFWTEFVSCDGLCSAGRERLMRDLQFSRRERPIVAQLFGAKPENFYKSAKLIKELGFDGIDINMGCPQRNIIKQGAGANLIKTPDLAREIIRETKRGAGSLPISVKTRIGFEKNEIEEWLSVLIEEKPAVITIHGRTKKGMSDVPADWEIIKKGVEMAKGTGILIIGNGDVKGIEEGKKRVEESGVDGIMVGRGIFANPCLFNSKFKILTKKEKLKILLKHIKLFEKLYGENKKNIKVFGGRSKNFVLMKKYIKIYASGFDGAKELRIKLMHANNAEDLKKIISKRSES